MVHGNCVTIGCLPIENDPIEELYLLVGQAFGKRTIPIHIFPRPMTSEALASLLSTTASPETQALWRELAAGYEAFESSKRVPTVDVDDSGAYVVRPR
jgi:murein L,D-transpeptidase YafK